MDIFESPSARGRGDFWAITSYWNPVAYRRKYANYRLFREHLKAPLVAIELAFEGDFELRREDADILVQLRGELVQPRRGDSVGERLLREKPDRRVDELRNDVPSTPGRCSGARGCRP